MTFSQPPPLAPSKFAHLLNQSAKLSRVSGAISSRVKLSMLLCEISYSRLKLWAAMGSLDASTSRIDCHLPVSNSISYASSRYDKLVVAVGSTSSTHGVPGLENCFQLKTIGDAQAIRRRVMDNFEIASLPTTSPEERRRLLSFVVCGGGPTGVETAAV